MEGQIQRVQTQPLQFCRHSHAPGFFAPTRSRRPRLPCRCAPSRSKGRPRCRSSKWRTDGRQATPPTPAAAPGKDASSGAWPSDSACAIFRWISRKPSSASPSLPLTHSKSPGLAPDRKIALPRSTSPRTVRLATTDRVLRRVAPCQDQAEPAAAARAMPVEEIVEPGPRAGVRKPQGQEEVSRSRTHGGDVTRSAGERLIADGLRRVNFS